MKPEDKMSILESSSVSVLESTRKDFEALLSSAYSSTSEDHSSRSSKSNASKTLLRKKRLKKNGDKPPIEMVDLTPDRKSSKQSSGEVNTAFWHEKDDQQRNSGATTPASSVKSSSSRSTHKDVNKLQPLRVASSLASAVQHTVMIHSQESESGSEESEIQSSRRPLSSIASSKSKSHKQKKSPSRPSISESEVSNSASERPVSEEPSPIGCSVLKLIVHHSGCLILDQPKARPMVIVHALDSQTGRYLQQNGLAVPPQFTGAWTQMDGNSAASPTWNQELVFRFDVTQQLTDVLLLFELVTEPSGESSGSEQQCQLAWGFLRPVSRTGVKHTNKKVQLQLYQIPFLRRRFPSSSSKANVSDFFSLGFQNQKRDKYPATLYVTLLPNESVATASSSSQQQMSDQSLISLTSPVRRGRLSGQPFKLPTRRCFTFASKSGALFASYNPEGTLLAVAITSGDIYLHQIGVKTEPVQLRGHQGNVYDLDWTADEFLSSGADCTARLWNLKAVGSSSILAHPAYVYSARFGSEDRIVTACYDQLIRLWISMRLMASYTQHNASVNSLCWDTRRERLYSGDAAGLICLWNTDHSTELQFEK